MRHRSRHYRPDAPAIISEANSFLVAEAMHSAIFGGRDRGMNGTWLGTGWRAAKELGRRDISGKTGTTNEAKDVRFSGFNGKLVATAWVGLMTTGANWAAPLPVMSMVRQCGATHLD